MVAKSQVELLPEEPLKVRKNRRVTLHYRILLSSGVEFDASPPESPLQFVCGRGETIPGLEKRIIGLESGDQKEFVVPPEEAFGPRDETLVKTLLRDQLPTELEPTVGLTVPCRDKGTEVIFRIVRIDDDRILGDFNHPLAGQPLRYQITIIDVDEPVADPMFF